MLWNKQLKTALSTVLVISTLYPFSFSALGKKAVEDKPPQVVSQQADVSPSKITSVDSKLATEAEHSDSVSINEASAEELAQKLSGIGKQKAKAIVEYREKYGAFSSIENILEVQGIGPAFLEKNKDKLRL